MWGIVPPYFILDIGYVYIIYCYEQAKMPILLLNMKNRSVIFTIIGVGWYVAASLLIQFGIGLWLDRCRLNTFPLLSLIGLGLGTIIMFYGVYKMVRQIQLTDKEEKTKDKINH